MAWTPWRKIADRLSWYVEHGLHLPVVYELGLTQDMTDMKEPERVYLGTAVTEAGELTRLGQGEHPHSGKVAQALADGRVVFFRSNGAPTPEAAQALLAERAQEHTFPWNG